MPDDGAPVRTFMGISDHRLFFVLVANGYAPGTDVPDRPAASGRYRCVCGLGTLALSGGCCTVCSGLMVRLCMSTKIRGKGTIPTGRAIFLTMAGMKVRSFLISNCHFLAGPLSYRWPPRRCGGVNAVPRLLPQTRRMDPERVWWPRRTSKQISLLQRNEYGRLHRISGRSDRSPKSRRHSWGVSSCFCRGLGFWHEMDDGLDERYPEILRKRLQHSGNGTRISSHLALVYAFSGELHAAIFSR